MDIRILKYFLTVAREESITRAAEVLHITQPTLSRQLTQLEEEVGSKLFIRGTRKIVLTGEGMLLCRRAGEIADLEDKTEMELAASQQLVMDWVFRQRRIKGREPSRYRMDYRAGLQIIRNR